MRRQRLGIMARIGGLTLTIVLALVTCAGADDFYREDLRIAWSAAEPHGLEALLIRPSAPGRYPLALLSHGTPRDAAERRLMSPYQFYAPAMEFARRGFAALVVMRRGYGTSDGNAENVPTCGRRNYAVAARNSTLDLRAAIAAMAMRPDVATDAMIAVGHSAGGLATVALTADAPHGLAAAVSFAGGRGSRADNDVCQEDDLVAAFAEFGKTSRTPMLWIYAQNDLFFGPSLARRLHDGFVASGGQAEFVAAPAFGRDGHRLFPDGMAQWTPSVDSFLNAHGLEHGSPLALPRTAALPPPPLNGKGVQDFATYLAAAPHKAFAISASGAFAWRTRQRSAQEARRAALDACARYATNCAIYAVDDERPAQ